jgi:hypothetical protein
MTMSYSQDMVEELHSLKHEAAHALNGNPEEWQQIAREKAHSLGEDIQTLLTDFRSALTVEEGKVEHALAGPHRTGAGIRARAAIAIEQANSFMQRKRQPLCRNPAI